MFRRLAFGVTVWMACAAVGHASELVWFGGTKSSWPSSWTALTSLNDPSDYADSASQDRVDFVGDGTYPGAYWAEDSSYIYFRVRVDVGTVTNDPWNKRTFSDTVHILIDYNQTGDLPDYGFSWDTNQDSGDSSTNHGLEMTILGTSGTTWNAVKMDDIDGNSGQKLTRDINGNGRTGDGYVRTIDSESTTTFGTTTFIDFAVSWDYLTNSAKGNTNLAPGQTWRIALGSIYNANDHNNIDTDIAGGSSPSSSVSSGWSDTFGPKGVPEPSSFVVLGAIVLSGYVGCRLRGKKQDPQASANAGPTGLAS